MEEKIKSNDWYKEAGVMTDQGYILIEEDGEYYWVKNEN